MPPNSDETILSMGNRNCTGKNLKEFLWREIMATARQRRAARKNIQKAARAARRKKTIKHLPKKVRTALGKQGAKMARKKR